MTRRAKMTEAILKMMENPDRVRNIGLIGHIDHGKTTLSDSLVAKAGLLSESLAGEARVLDYMEEEQRRGITMKSANISLYYAEGLDNGDSSRADPSIDGGYLINLVDTPGHLDFTGKVTRALRLIDGVVVIVDAVEEVSSQTETVVRQALEEAVKPILFINKIDRLFNELKLDLSQIKDKFLRIITDFNRLIAQYAYDPFKDSWQVDAEKGTVIFGSALHKWGFIIPQIVKNKHSIGYIQKAYSEGNVRELTKIYPVWEAVLMSVVKNLPDPKTAQQYRIPYIWKGNIDSKIGKAMQSCDPDGPLVIFLSKVQKIKNRLFGTGRIFSGSIDEKERIYLVNADKRSYIQQLSIFMGSRIEPVKRVPAGNIIGIGGIEHLRSGETIISTKSDKNMVPFENVRYVSEPVLTVSIEPAMLKDLDRLEEILEEIRIEDPNINILVSKDTGEVLVSGMGPLHLEIIAKMIAERGIEVTVSPPISVFYESVEGESQPVKAVDNTGNNFITLSVSRLNKDRANYFRKVERRILSNQYLREKSMMDSGLFDETFIKGFLNVDKYHNVLISANPEGLQLGDKMQKQFIRIIENFCKNGPIVREPFSELLITVHGLELDKEATHDENIFVITTISREAFYKAVDEAHPVIIEPIYFMIITCPEAFIGKVTSLITRNKGKIIEIKNKDFMAEINATMSVRHSIDFAQEVRDKTSGKVFWNSIFDSYQKVPESEMELIVKDIKFRKGIW